jgi:2,3-bisphosphoglycerate-dependent phosphoglycerate mutase
VNETAGPRLLAVLIRHGDYHQLADTPSAHQPFPLNAIGEQQAVGAAPWLLEQLLSKGWCLDGVVDSSQMLRAWQTAQLIIQGLEGKRSENLKLETFDNLAERGLGCAANLSLHQIAKIMRQDPRYGTPPPDWKSNSHYRLPLQGAESLLEAGKRVAGHLCQRMAALAASVHQDTIKVFVGHGAAFRHAAYHLGVLEFEQLTRLSMYHCRPVCLEYLATDQWRHTLGDWKVRARLNSSLD